MAKPSDVSEEVNLGEIAEKLGRYIERLPEVEAAELRGPIPDGDYDYTISYPYGNGQDGSPNAAIKVFDLVPLIAPAGSRHRIRTARPYYTIIEPAEDRESIERAVRECFDETFAYCYPGFGIDEKDVFNVHPYDNLLIHVTHPGGDGLSVVKLSKTTHPDIEDRADFIEENFLRIREGTYI
ncbi:hypothetical protein CMO89_04850 [Candidatus Woesearchaeota archaeon]|nr:hypothetical protein [Candidatus Woesearchaeota archaeon]|tara:strand:- start:3566 stop:4111 length:546 start_codon:yes stop_codon:yes gene_type:complete